MKRLLALLLLLAVAFSLTACAGEEDTTAPSTSLPVVQDVPGKTTFPEGDSVGLEYAVNDDGASCTITGVGDCTDVYISVGETLDGYAVTAVGASAFFANTDIKGIRFSDSLLTVGEYAFFECVNLETVILGNGIQALDTYCFAGCAAITEITMPESMERIATGAFYACYGMQKVLITDLEHWCSIIFEGIYANPLMLARQLYCNDELVTRLEIPESVTVIGPWTFARCTSVTDVVLHENVTEVGQRAFMECTNVSTVHYLGTVESWKNVILGSNWSFLVKNYVISCADGEIKG